MEAAIDDIRSVWIKGRICEDEVIFSMETETETELWHIPVRLISAIQRMAYGTLQ